MRATGMKVGMLAAFLVAVIFVSGCSPYALYRKEARDTTVPAVDALPVDLAQTAGPAAS